MKSVGNSDFKYLNARSFKSRTGVLLDYGVYSSKNWNIIFTKKTPSNEMLKCKYSSSGNSSCILKADNYEYK